MSRTTVAATWLCLAIPLVMSTALESNVRASLLSTALESNGYHLNDVIPVGSNDVTERDTVSMESQFEDSRVSTSSQGHWVKAELRALEAGRRTKRAAFTNKGRTWPHRIPYKIDKSYKPDQAHILRRILKLIEEHLCVTYVEEPTFDPDNNDYDTNAFIKLFNGNICAAPYGRGNKDYGPRTVSACHQFHTMIHEMFHSLGVMHDQQAPGRDEHLVVVMGNVDKASRGQFPKLNNTKHVIQEEEFDSSSKMLYGLTDMSSNGLAVLLPLREEEFQLNNGRRTGMSNVFYDLNKVYRCRELYCNDSQVDCGRGYYTKVKGQCQCVCPEGFEPSTRCQTLVDAKSYNSKWPDADITLYAESPGLCPQGFQVGVVNVTGRRHPHYVKDQFFHVPHSKTTPFWFCSKRTSGGVTPDWENMPMGQYCVIKPRGVECQEPFTLGEFHVRSSTRPKTSGDIGDTVIKGYDVTMRFCCRNDREPIYPLDLPAQRPFRLIVYNKHCQEIKGLRHRYGRVALFMSEYGATTTRPTTIIANSTRSKYLSFGQCLYYPPGYGCSHMVTLNSTHRYQTILTPGFDSDHGERNRRCLYSFKVPASSKILVTFHTFDVDKDDLFKSRRFNRWSEPMYLTNANAPYQMVTEKDFLFMEYWSSNHNTTSNKGVRFSVEVILAQDECYDISNRGEFYAGNKSVAESMEACVSWTDAVGCEDFPWGSREVLGLLTSGRSCRNPDGALLQPWCYVSVHGHMCQRRYCDVCNRLDVVDRLEDCTELIQADPAFCGSALQRFSCAKTCQLPVNDVRTKTAKCRPPVLPKAAKRKSRFQRMYRVGDKVTFKCPGVKVTEESGLHELECLMDGWTALPSTCNDCPKGWRVYGDRCWAFQNTPLTQANAIKHCQAQNGTLFKIHNAKDLKMIRKFKKTSKESGASWNTWLNGQRREAHSRWSTLDDLRPLTFFRWSPKARSSDGRYRYLYLRGERKTHPGTYDTEAREGKRNRFFCQVRRAKEMTCFDRSSSCQRILADVPDLCVRGEIQATVKNYCQMACGFCTEETGRASKKNRPGIGLGECHEPQGQGYHRVTADRSVDVGHVIKFECDKGLYHVGGDLARVCQADGKLLGSEPKCQATPLAVDINKGDIRRRPTHTLLKNAFLLDVDGFRIPFDGVITHWYFYPTTPGSLALLVYRKGDNRNGANTTDANNGRWSFHLVGHNDVNVTRVNQAWSQVVPDGQRIRVKTGDLFGSYSTKVKVAASGCEGTKIQLTILHKQQAKSLQQLMRMKNPFNKRHCLTPSLGLRIEPLISKKIKKP